MYLITLRAASYLNVQLLHLSMENIYEIPENAYSFQQCLNSFNRFLTISEMVFKVLFLDQVLLYNLTNHVLQVLYNLNAYQAKMSNQHKKGKEKAVHYV